MHARGFLRKVQVTGGSTYIVSLPKDWARMTGIDKGSYVEILVEKDGSLRLLPAGRRREEFSATLRIPRGSPPERVLREFISRYLAGYHTIKIVFEEPASRYRSLLRSVIPDKLIGVEIVEEGTNHVVAQCLVSVDVLPLETAIQRAYRVAYTMVSDVVASLRKTDPEVVRDVVARDDLVDKFYLYSVRQLNALLTGLISPGDIGLERLSDALTYRVMVKNLERIGDHARRMAEALASGLGGMPGVIDDLEKLGDFSLRVFKDAFASFRRRDTDKAHSVIDTVLARLGELEQRVLLGMMSSGMGPEEVSRVRLITDSLKRVAEYSADIAELAIDLSV